MGRERITAVIDSGRPVAERLAQDDELHDHLKAAYSSARWVYDELMGNQGTTGMARRVARDSDIQDELKNAIDELREAGRRAQGAEESNRRRNMMFLLFGIAIGVFFNPVTGPGTRDWVKVKIVGPDEPFEYTSNES